MSLCMFPSTEFLFLKFNLSANSFNLSSLSGMTIHFKKISVYNFFRFLFDNEKIAIEEMYTVKRRV